jgi:spore coat protein CotF
MSTIMSTISEATGMKPGDDVIALGMLTAAKMKAMAYTGAILESVTPELRHIFNTHLQDTLTEHERCTQLAVKRGWYKAHEGASGLLQQAIQDAKPILQ